MIELLLIAIIVISAVGVFGIQARLDRERLRRRRAADAYAAATAETGEQRTIDLIGREAYAAMTSRIDALLARHSGQSCASFELTCGPNSREGADELHSLLPGMPVELNFCYESGVRLVDVFSSGNRVGRLALAEANALRNIVDDNIATGAYVAEQNCYGIEDSHRMAIIVFYKPRSQRALRLPGIRQAFTRQSIKENLTQN